MSHQGRKGLTAVGTSGANTSYTCRDYRNEMILLALNRRLHEERLSTRERAAIEEKIRDLEALMEMD